LAQRTEVQSFSGLWGGKGKKQLTEEQKELARLKKDLADVKMERDILKKAVSIFSVSDRKSTNS
jgi:transposase